MSKVSDALIAWLETFTPEGGMTATNIQTDMQPSTPVTFALVKEPTVNVKRYVSGMEIHTDYYQFSARLDTQYNADRKENASWLEALEHWIVENNKSGNLPTINDISVDEVVITSSYYIGLTNDNTSVYSLTLAIKYTYFPETEVTEGD